MAITDNLKQLKAKINKAAARSGRDPGEITLVAVTKTFPAETILQAVQAGIRIIGENRVQEAKEKFTCIGDQVEWHLVGHLQTNKVKDALKIFSMIHSIDSIHLAQEIEKRAEKPVRCLIEVNTSKEDTKFGIEPGKLFEFYESVKNFKKIDIQGLMTIGPGWAITDPEASRPCFKLLRELRDELSQANDTQLSVLSMGMTSDYEVAIEEGSTMIRVGTAIFGQR
ncbi:MAG TPA: YggS family pyridoxal phosphate-dependent enzyme [bacterium]